MCCYFPPSKFIMLLPNPNKGRRCNGSKPKVQNIHLNTKAPVKMTYDTNSDWKGKTDGWVMLAIAWLTTCQTEHHLQMPTWGIWFLQAITHVEPKFYQQEKLLGEEFGEAKISLDLTHGYQNMTPLKNSYFNPILTGVELSSKWWINFSWWGTKK